MSESGKLKKTFVILALTGFLSGLLIELIIYLCVSSTEAILENKWKLILGLLGSGLYGAVAMGGSIVYHIESWGLWRATITHYLLTLVSFLITNALLGWFSSNILVWILIGFTVLYLIIWLVEGLIWSRRIKKMNQDLEKMIQKEEEDEHL